MSAVLPPRPAGRRLGQRGANFPNHRSEALGHGFVDEGLQPLRDEPNDVRNMNHAPKPLGV
jgi:hypothetical protein